jgi:hypothetical protein
MQGRSRAGPRIFPHPVNFPEEFDSNPVEDSLLPENATRRLRRTGGSPGGSNAELFRAFASRSTTRVFWHVGVFSNLVLLAVVTGSVVLQLVIHQLPWTQALFQISPLSTWDLAICLALGLVPVTLIELAKLTGQRRSAKP